MHAPFLNQELYDSLLKKARKFLQPLKQKFLIVTLSGKLYFKFESVDKNWSELKRVWSLVRVKKVRIRLWILQVWWWDLASCWFGSPGVFPRKNPCLFRIMWISPYEPLDDERSAWAPYTLRWVCNWAHYTQTMQVWLGRKMFSMQSKVKHAHQLLLKKFESD